MGILKDSLNKIRETMKQLGFKESQEIFDFEQLPASIVDNAFRIELTSARKVEDVVGGKIKEITFSVWTLNIIKERKNRMDFYVDLVTNGAELIEETLENKFPGEEFEVTGNNSADSVDDELVIRMDCSFKLEVRNG